MSRPLKPATEACHPPTVGLEHAKLCTANPSSHVPYQNETLPGELRAAASVDKFKSELVHIDLRQLLQDSHYD